MSNSAAWLQAQIRSYIEGPKSPFEEPELVSTANRIAVGELEPELFLRYLKTTIDYTDTVLERADHTEQSAFLRFLVYSELPNANAAVRNSLVSLLERCNTLDFDGLSLEILSILARSTRAPAQRLAKKYIPLIRDAHIKQPAWKFVEVLAALGSVVGDSIYSGADLVSDISKLVSTKGFDEALRARSSIWLNSRFALDSIKLAQLVLPAITDNPRRFPRSDELRSDIQSVSANTATMH